mgnify:CR=1 FL=1
MWIPDFLRAEEGILDLITTLSVAIINSLLVVLLLHRSGLTRTMSGFPVFMFLLLLGAFPQVHMLWKGQLLVLLVLLILLQLQQVSQSVVVQEGVFLSGVLLGIATLLQSEMIFGVLVLWLFMFFERLFTLRSFFASILGWGVVVFLYGVVGYLGWIALGGFPTITLQWMGVYTDTFEMIVFGFLVIMMVLAGVVAFANVAREGLRVRAMLIGIVITTKIGILSLVLVMLFGQTAFQTMFLALCAIVLTIYAYINQTSLHGGITLFVILSLLSIYVVNNFVLPINI